MRIGASGGGSTETLDPTQAANTVTIINSFMIYGYIVEYDTGRKILPSVAESWEPRAGATEWVFNIRKGVEFHNGKSWTPTTSSIRSTATAGPTTSR